MTVNAIGCGFLAAAAMTDLANRRIYRLWSLTALAFGLMAVVLAGRWLNLLVALLLWGSAYGLWARGGIGGGDVWLAAYQGLILGPEALLALLVGSLMGSVTAIGCIVLGRLSWEDSLPVGFFWAAGGLLILLTGWRIWPG